MKKITVVVAGLPGKMATLVAEAIMAQEDMQLFYYALSEDRVGSADRFGKIRLIPISEGHENVLKRCRAEIDLVVDFTQPAAVNQNAEMYCAAGIPFVMGTTGGDRQKLVDTICHGSEVSAVIATNMAAPVVMFQEMIKFAAASFPGGLKGFGLLRKESHQATKKDPSGTMVSLQPAFEALIGEPVTTDRIYTVRDRRVQELELGIPREYLDGHGYHLYRLMSPDGTVELEFTHNVLGRSVYVDGALRAIRFLAKHLQDKGKVFSMMDVLHG